MKKVRLATVWLDGCSGCHMSFLDQDERLIALAERADLVYGPFVDAKIFPDEVDITLVEGAVSSDEDEEKIRHIRRHTRTLVSLGDCAVTGNVSAMRNPLKVGEMLRDVYAEGNSDAGSVPGEDIPLLLERVRPVHAVVAVDVFVPGCPPSADTIALALEALLDGRTPDLSGQTRFGA
jgi:NAD-reducing hydrogenase small subunit